MKEHYFTEYYTKLMKPVNGFVIEKSAELHSVTGKIKKDTIVYTVYDGDDGLVDCFKTLKEAQECARRYQL